MYAVHVYSMHCCVLPCSLLKELGQGAVQLCVLKVKATCPEEGHLQILVSRKRKTVEMLNVD